jgi:predicted house-cleaning noncanonical NTP pyrophosphatase (MazG superfamily)
MTEDYKNKLRHYSLEELENMLNDARNMPPAELDRSEFLAALLEVIKEKRSLLTRITPM